MTERVFKPSMIYIWFIVVFGSFRLRLSRDWYEGYESYCWCGWFVRSTWARSCSRGTGVGASAIFCADVPIRPDTKIGDFWSCDLGSQVDAKNRGFFGSDPEVVVKITISP